ncbi:MAG: LacI family transcriptional regulator [Ruminococcaceae bacterium]|nr:LacI family transcriptional regulator [Oscillospiraceae bacterium]
MTSNDKKTIGLLVEDISADYTKEIVRSVDLAIPQNSGVRLIVMAGRHDDGLCGDENLRSYRSVCNTIYQLGASCEVDGLIVALGSLSNMGERALRSDAMALLQNVPKVFISADIPGCTAVCYDNASGIREALELLTNVYGYTRLCMLGGREDNSDAAERRAIFAAYLKEKGLEFPARAYVATDMSDGCAAEAGRLLDANPDAQAVFCVNDAVARGLYEAMDARGLVPGRDLMVFGFDNTRMSAEMDPPLASIGPSGQSIGEKAVELLLDILAGKETASESVPTKLFARASLDYERFDLTPLALQTMNDAGINRMFDDCFYRYRSEHRGREGVDLRRLFLELAHRMQATMARRYMSLEEFDEVTKMVDVFVDNGAMEYTDIHRLMRGIQRVQASVNSLQRSVAANVAINRLFLRTKDKLLLAYAEQKARDTRQTNERRGDLQEYLNLCTDYTCRGEDKLDAIVEHLAMLGLRNAALFLYDKPAVFVPGTGTRLSGTIRLRCILKDGEAYLPSSDRQKGPVNVAFLREDMPAKCKSYLAFPVFCARTIYGFLACELAGSVYDRGEFVANLLGRTLYLNEINTGIQP